MAIQFFNRQLNADKERSLGRLDARNGLSDGDDRP